MIQRLVPGYVRCAGVRSRTGVTDLYPRAARKNFRDFITFAVGAFILLANLGATKAFADDGILRRIVDPETGEFAATHLSYTTAEPREYSNGAIVDTRWSAPAGKKAILVSSGELEFPDGTVVSKTFSFASTSSGAKGRACGSGPVTLSGLRSAETPSTHLRCFVELRVLEKKGGAWISHVFRRTETQTWQAVPAGRVSRLRLQESHGKPERMFDYVIPSRSECALCHRGRRGSEKFGPIGLTSLRLSSSSLSAMVDQDLDRGREGRFPSLPASDEERAARNYLHSNCAFCHSPNGLGASSGLLLDAEETDERKLGVCKRPVAVSVDESLAQFDIEPGHPERSLLVLRMATLDPRLAMPEFGRAFIDTEGIGIVSNWIASMKGRCDERTSGR